MTAGNSITAVELGEKGGLDETWSGVLAGAAEGRWAEALAPHPGRPVLAPAWAAPRPEALSSRTPLNNQASKACGAWELHPGRELLILALCHYFLHFLLLKYFEFLIH